MVSREPRDCTLTSCYHLCLEKTEDHEQQMGTVETRAHRQFLFHSLLHTKGHCLGLETGWLETQTSCLLNVDGTELGSRTDPLGHA